MKRFILAFLLSIPFVLIAQRRPKIKGNRSVIEITQELPPFNALELVDNLEVTVKKSFGEEVSITADDNLVDVLKFEVVDSTLVISSFYDIVSKKKLDITVGYKELKSITLKDGKVEGNGLLASDELYVSTFGRSELKLDTSGFFAEIVAEDTSKLEMNVDVDSLVVGMRQRADGFLYLTGGSTQLTLEENASLTAEGTTEYCTITMTSNSKLKADRLETAEASLVAKASAFARINAYRTFSLNAEADSRTHLYGNPKITINAFLDRAQLVKKED